MEAESIVVESVTTVQKSELGTVITEMEGVVHLEPTADSTPAIVNGVSKNASEEVVKNLEKELDTKAKVDPPSLPADDSEEKDAAPSPVPESTNEDMIKEKPAHDDSEVERGATENTETSEPLASEAPEGTTEIKEDNPALEGDGEEKDSTTALAASSEDVDQANDAEEDESGETDKTTQAETGTAKVSESADEDANIGSDSAEVQTKSLGEVEKEPVDKESADGQPPTKTEETSAGSEPTAAVPDSSKIAEEEVAESTEGLVDEPELPDQGKAEEASPTETEEARTLDADPASNDDPAEAPSGPDDAVEKTGVEGADTSESPTSDSPSKTETVDDSGQANEATESSPETVAPEPKESKSMPSDTVDVKDVVSEAVNEAVVVAKSTAESVTQKASDTAQ